jgi:uncharacterized protein (TIGR01777 family)
MKTFVARSRIDAPAGEVFAWHCRPGALERLSPPWDKPTLLEQTGSVMDEGSRVVLSVPMGPFKKRWVSEHKGFEAGHRFVDEQVEGPFAHWRHTHTVDPDGATRSILEDRIEYALPLGPLGDLFGGGAVERKLKRIFDYRHALTRGDLERHHALAAPPLRIAVSGASGLVGSALVPYLTTAGHTVSRLVRGTAKPGEIAWDPAKGTIDAAALEGQDAVVHLAGEPIAAGRWNDAVKKRILESRFQGTTVLCQALAKLARPPRVLVSASAIGFYGNRGTEDLDEKSSPGTGFLADVCRAWEEATAPAKGIRVVNLRIGIVLAAAGGALAKMLPPFLMGAGGPVGGGKQVMSWIALDDLLGAIEFALLRESLSGPVNAVGPEPLGQAAFARGLGHVLGRPAFAPLPAFTVKLLFGEMGRELLLAGQRVHPRALEAAGFRFRHRTLQSALRFELGRLEPQEDAAPLPLPMAARAT